jgi:hypothetical protein
LRQRDQERRNQHQEGGELKLSISDKGSWHCLVNLSFMRTISRYNNNEIPLTSSSVSGLYSNI